MNGPDKKAAHIQAEQVRVLFSGLPASNVSGILLATLLAYAQQDVINSTVIVGWLALIMAIAVARAAFFGWHRRAASAVADSTIWLRRFRVSVVISGAGWGLAGWLLFPSNEVVHQSLLAFVLAGLSAGATTAYSADIMCIISFLLPALLPFMLRLFVEGGDFSATMGIAVLLFIGFMLASMRHVYQRLRENIVLRIEAAEREQALQESEARFRHMFEQNDSAMLLIDPASGAIVNANAAAGRFYGYAIEHLRNMNIAEINIQKQEGIAAPRHQVIPDDRNHFVFSHRLSNGKVRTVEIHSSSVDVSGRGHLFSIVHDITDRKVAEANLHLHDAALNASANAVVITNMDGRIVWANQAFTKLTGYRLEEAAGHALKELTRAGPERDSRFDHLWRTLLTGEPWHGELISHHKDGSPYHEETTITPVRDENNEISHFVAVKQDISERKIVEEHVHNLAFYDALTQLPNSRLLHERIAHALVSCKRDGHYGALMFLDLDNFKALNDTHGHDFGDLLLIEVAYRLTHCVRAEDTAARLGGDEYVVMLEKLNIDKGIASSIASNVAEKLRASLGKPYLLQHQRSVGSSTTVEYRCTASIGIVLFNHEANKEGLLKWADTAMYQAKSSGGNQFCFYDSKD
jgi:diguanylate cyclase (GGDEF)-like protein/PAS domain S-box-containing protein